MKRLVKKGIAYYTVGDTAKLLRTNAMKVRELMANGTLEWLNVQDNGRLLITEVSLFAYQRALVAEARELGKRVNKPR